MFPWKEACIFIYKVKSSSHRDVFCQVKFDRTTKTFKNVVEHLLQNKFSFHLKLGEKKLNQNFLWICASTHYVLYNYQVSGNSVQRFQRSCAEKKNRTDGHVKNIIPSATRCVGYNKLRIKRRVLNTTMIGLI